MKKLTLLLSLFLCLCACHKANKGAAAKKQIYTVQEQTHNTTLYFTGIIAPLNLYNVSTPVDGTINKINFKFGQTVHKDDVLFIIRSNKFAEDYHAALTGYLDAKDKYLNQKDTMAGNEELHKAGLISESEYQQDKSTYSDSYIGYLQAEQKLDNVTKSAKGYTNTTTNTADLSLNNLEHVKAALDAVVDTLTIRAPTEGVILSAPKESDSGSDKKLVSGSEVKQNQTLVSIGNLSGITLKINVNEVNINQIKIGQKVKVSGVAFPGIELAGKVNSIDAQASSDASGGLPTFPVEIVVPSITSNQTKIIHVGMSAKIELLLEHPSTISVPINAISNIDGKNIVKIIINPKKFTTKNVQVTTGATNMDSVIIEEGLKVGDKILVTN